MRNLTRETQLQRPRFKNSEVEVDLIVEPTVPSGMETTTSIHDSTLHGASVEMVLGMTSVVGFVFIAALFAIIIIIFWVLCTKDDDSDNGTVNNEILEANTRKNGFRNELVLSDSELSDLRRELSDIASLVDQSKRISHGADDVDDLVPHIEITVMVCFTFSPHGIILFLFYNQESSPRASSATVTNIH